jgi:AcrR family transcriptional regulator
MRSTLTAGEIYRAALQLVDAEGLESLTMRKLAAELGVAAMTLYGHVSTKDDLLLGVLNLVNEEIALPDSSVPPWQAYRDVSREFRRVALLHPNLVPVIMRRPPTGAQGLLTLEAALDALRRAGVPPSLAAGAYRLMASFAIGFVSLECGGFFHPVDVDAGERVAPIDISAIPRIVEMAPHLTEWDADAEFERGMDMLIGVVAGWVESPPPGQVVEDDGGGGGHVERVDAVAHGDPHPAVGRP